MSQKLTAKFIENVKPSAARREISDSGCTGLWLIVQPSGHTSFAARYRFSGKTRKLTLEAATLADAHVECKEAIWLAKAGVDPTQVKREAKQEHALAQANTFAAVALLYLDDSDVKKLRTHDQLKDMLTRLAFPHIGDVPIAELKKSQIVKALDHVVKHSGPVAADRCLSAIMGVLKFHSDRSDDYLLPRIRPRTKASERARTRILDDNEIRKLWATGDVFCQFLLLTSARRSEAAGMKWKEIDGADWMLPAARNKTKKHDLLRTLPKQTLKLLPERGAPDDYVFGLTPDQPLGNFGRMKERLDAASGITEHWTLHDLRRTARSLMSRAGVNADHAERVLGHVIGGVRGVYDRHEYQAEKAHALKELAGLLTVIVDPPKGNVTKLRRRA